MAERSNINVLLVKGAPFDEVKSELQKLGMIVDAEDRGWGFLTGSIAQERENDLRAVKGVEVVAPNRKVELAGG